MKTKYRVVGDSYCGFEVQIKRWWFPFWLQAGTNTHPSLESAKRMIERLKNHSTVYYEE